MQTTLPKPEMRLPQSPAASLLTCESFALPFKHNMEMSCSPDSHAM
jgi:hypothetical protein